MSSTAIQLARDLEHSCVSKEEVITLLDRPEVKGDLEFLVRLFRRQYWWRIWVIQEVSCAKAQWSHCVRRSNTLEHPRRHLRHPENSRLPAALPILHPPVIHPHPNSRRTSWAPTLPLLTTPHRPTPPGTPPLAQKQEIYRSER